MTTINDILFGGAAQARRGLGGALRLVDAARRELSVSTHASGALASLFDMPVGNVLLDAWYGNRLVRTACANTLAQPGLREEVQLFTTTVTCSYRPTLDLDTAGRRLTVAQLDLELELKLESLVLEVAGGRVTAVGPGVGTAVWGSASVCCGSAAFVSCAPAFAAQAQTAANRTMRERNVRVRVKVVNRFVIEMLLV